MNAGHQLNNGAHSSVHVCGADLPADVPNGLWEWVCVIDNVLGCALEAAMYSVAAYIAFNNQSHPLMLLAIAGMGAMACNRKSHSLIGTLQEQLIVCTVRKPMAAMMFGSLPLFNKPFWQTIYDVRGVMAGGVHQVCNVSTHSTLALMFLIIDFLGETVYKMASYPVMLLVFDQKHKDKHAPVSHFVKRTSLMAHGGIAVGVCAATLFSMYKWAGNNAKIAALLSINYTLDPLLTKWSTANVMTSTFAIAATCGLIGYTGAISPLLAGVLVVSGLVCVIADAHAGWKNVSSAMFFLSVAFTAPSMVLSLFSFAVAVAIIVLNNTIPSIAMMVPIITCKTKPMHSQMKFKGTLRSKIIMGAAVHAASMLAAMSAVHGYSEKLWTAIYPSAMLYHNTDEGFPIKDERIFEDATAKYDNAKWNNTCRTGRCMHVAWCDPGECDVCDITDSHRTPNNHRDVVIEILRKRHQFALSPSDLSAVGVVAVWTAVTYLSAGEPMKTMAPTMESMQNVLHTLNPGATLGSATGYGRGAFADERKELPLLGLAALHAVATADRKTSPILRYDMIQKNNEMLLFAVEDGVPVPKVPRSLTFPHPAVKMALAAVEAQKNFFRAGAPTIHCMQIALSAQLLASTVVMMCMLGAQAERARGDGIIGTMSDVSGFDGAQHAVFTLPEGCMQVMDCIAEFSLVGLFGALVMFGRLLTRTIRDTLVKSTGVTVTLFGSQATGDSDTSDGNSNRMVAYMSTCVGLKLCRVPERVATLFDDGYTYYAHGALIGCQGDNALQMNMTSEPTMTITNLVERMARIGQVVKPGEESQNITHLDDILYLGHGISMAKVITYDINDAEYITYQPIVIRPYEKFIAKFAITWSDRCTGTQGLSRMKKKIMGYISAYAHMGTYIPVMVAMMYIHGYSSQDWSQLPYIHRMSELEVGTAPSLTDVAYRSIPAVGTGERSVVMVKAGCSKDVVLHLMTIILRPYIAPAVISRIIDNLLTVWGPSHTMYPEIDQWAVNTKMLIVKYRGKVMGLMQLDKVTEAIAMSAEESAIAASLSHSKRKISANCPECNNGSFIASPCICSNQMGARLAGVAYYAKLPARARTTKCKIGVINIGRGARASSVQAFNRLSFNTTCKGLSYSVHRSLRPFIIFHETAGAVCT